MLGSPSVGMVDAMVDAMVEAHRQSPMFPTNLLTPI